MHTRSLPKKKKKMLPYRHAPEATQVPGPDTLRFLLEGLCETHCLCATIAQVFAGAESNCGCFGRTNNGYDAESLVRN
jgi:hypothetical protein